MLKNPRAMSALTRVTTKYFEQPLPDFIKAWESSKRYQHKWDVGVRKIGAGRKGLLKSMPDELLACVIPVKTACPPIMEKSRPKLFFQALT